MCNCILCTVGRDVYRNSPTPDVAPLKRVIAAIKAYDASLSPYPLNARDKKNMITYITQFSKNGVLHFVGLECFLMDKEETARWQYPQAE